MKLCPLHQRIVDRLTRERTDGLKFVRIDGKHQQFARLEAFQVERNLGPAIGDGDVGDAKAFLADDRQRHRVEVASTLCGGVEEDFSGRQLPVAIEVGVDNNPIEGCPGSPSGEGNLDHIGATIVTRRLLKVDRAEDHIRGEHFPLFEMLDLR